MKEYRVIMLGCAWLFASCNEKAAEPVKSEAQIKADQALAYERSGQPLRELQERQKAAQEEYQAELKRIDREEKRAIAREEQELHRIESQRQVDLARARLEATRVETANKLGIDLTPVPLPKPSSDPNLPPGVERAGSDGANGPIEIGKP